MKTKSANTGFSLVELAIGLAVVTILILAVTASAGIRDSARVQSAASSIQSLRSAAENYLSTGKLNYKDLTVKALQDAKLLPQNFKGVGTNPWGGDFILGPNPSDQTHFDIGLTGVELSNADKLTSFFNNTASAVTVDAHSSTWTATF